MTPSSDSRSPQLSVVVASGDDPLRLRWLLNALDEQSLADEHWEVIVAHDETVAEVESLLRTHPLAKRLKLRHVSAPAAASVGAKRNAAWRAARGGWVVFTEETCRPRSDWLEQALTAVRADAEAIIQGTTLPDPDEWAASVSPRRRTLSVRPPTPWAPASNIIYPRELLVRSGGFNESGLVGEEADLAQRSRSLGASLQAAPSMVVYAAVTEGGLFRSLRELERLQHLPRLLKQHPELRADLPMWCFYRRRHLWAPLCVVGLGLIRSHHFWGGLCLPWVVHAAPHHGRDARGRYREVAELPVRLMEDVVAMVYLARGSVRYRTLLL